MHTRRLVTNGVYLVLVAVFLFPGSIAAQNIQVEILGWPFFAFWTVILGPMAFVAFYLVAPLFERRIDPPSLTSEGR